MNQVKVKRISSHIQTAISNICAMEANDPLLKMITITAVEVTNDLSFAKVFFTTLDDTDVNQLEKELNDSTASYVRTKLCDMVELRHTPKLRFVFDSSIEYGNKIENIIKEIHNKEE
jgi:ribosome-binding factor A